MAYVSNQSINGFLARLVGEDGRTLFWFAACAGLGLLCLRLVADVIAAGNQFAALLILASYALLASPVTWSHHWVWVAPILIAFLGWWRNCRNLGLLVFTALGAVIFASRMIW